MRKMRTDEQNRGSSNTLSTPFEQQVDKASMINLYQSYPFILHLLTLPTLPPPNENLGWNHFFHIPAVLHGQHSAVRHICWQLDGTVRENGDPPQHPPAFQWHRRRAAAECTLHAPHCKAYPAAIISQPLILLALQRLNSPHP